MIITSKANKDVKMRTDKVLPKDIILDALTCQTYWLEGNYVKSDYWRNILREIGLKVKNTKEELILYI